MWNAQDYQQENGWYRPKPSGGGGGPLVHIVGDTTTSATGFTATFPENLGTGSKFLVIGALTSTALTTDISVNGHSFGSAIADNTQGTSLFAGTVTVTGSDSIVLTSSTDLSFLDVNIHVYSLSGLASTTPVVASNGTASTSTVSAAGVNAGDTVIAIGTNGGSAANFAGSAQVPGHSYNEAATFGQNTVIADWIAASTATFVATLSASTRPIIAAWR